MELVRPGRSLAERCARDAALREQLLRGLNDADLAALDASWGFWARPAQQIPGGRWTLWLLLTGRGFGKTHALSEFAHDRATAWPKSHGCLASRTAADARDTLVIGPSGLIATQKPWNPCEYVKSDRLVRWANGTTAHLYSSEEPDQLRGPNHHWAIGDEVAAWKAKKAADGQTALDHLRLSTRLRFAGYYPPQVALGTTPRRTEAVKALLKEALESPRGRLTRGHMRENASNLSPEFVADMEARYAGTRLARQELAGELVESVEGAILSLDLIHALREDLPVRDGARDLSFLDRVVVGVDPSGGADEQGIVVVGRAPKCPCGNGRPLPHGWVLRDASGRRSPEGWGAAAVASYAEWHADRVVGERNYGGDMVRHVVMTAAGGQAVRYVDENASRGKHVRAEPVLSLYEQGRMHHAGEFSTLEDELCGFTPEGYKGSGSPNRADAAVWAATHLLVRRTAEARVS